MNAPQPTDRIVWEDERQPGWFHDKWDGLYPSLPEALTDAVGGLPA